MDQDLQKQFCQITGFRKRLKLLSKIKPEETVGLEPSILKKSQLKALKKNKNAPKLIKIKRSAIDYLAKLTFRPKKSIERGMTSFLLKNFNLENSREYSREWFIFAQRTEERKKIKDKIREKKRRNRKKNPKPKVKGNKIIVIEEIRSTQNTSRNKIITKTKFEDFLKNDLLEEKSQRKRTLNSKFEKSQTSLRKKKKLSKIIIRVKRSPSYFQKKNNKKIPQSEIQKKTEKVLDQLVNNRISKKKTIKRIKTKNVNHTDNINHIENKNENEIDIEKQNGKENENENENEKEKENGKEKETGNLTKKINSRRETCIGYKNKKVRIKMKEEKKIDQAYNTNHIYNEIKINKKVQLENLNIDLGFDQIDSPDFQIINSKNYYIDNNIEFHPKEFIKNNFGYQPNNEDQGIPFQRTSTNQKNLNSSEFKYKPESMILQPQSEYLEQIFDDSEIFVDFEPNHIYEYNQQFMWY
ncbi:hypothetical protein M0812_25356 [Anaeramoeba flamelloides]|uniref:Uncharacterized protein n=1 Tax=Anaeramoeba flamelloides TaxID=1746091 RepID=A0AAV7YJI2_9EUKA|nr:hypothetical protein M0812_25356 [Anaeramoeba flamelloides]